MDIEKTLAFSGYRNSKLPEGGNGNCAEIVSLKCAISDAIENAIADGYVYFLTGMADGFDTFVAEAVIELKKEHPSIKLVCVLPFRDIAVRVPKFIAQYADDTICTGEKFNQGCYHVRNRYLVDNSSQLICYYDGQDGGTNYTVEYAYQKKKRVQNLFAESYQDIITKFHAKYYYCELMQKKTGGGDDRLTPTLFNSALEINPHQIEAALFAFKSPFSKGVLLADEVGLGKTIEAALVMCQLYAEQKTRQLVICPASLRKQWSLELAEKFNLSSFILDGRTWSAKDDSESIFDKGDIIITSYNFAAKFYKELSSVKWDLVVIDEAHKLRNSYRENNRTGQGIKLAIGDSKKILLTATPLQNNLAELYGIVSVIDEHIFGDIKSFREQYSGNNDLEELKERLSYFCKRTLRKDVAEYIKYTKRIGIQKRFRTSNAERKLYDGVSSFLQLENTFAVPNKQKMLTTLVIRKVLASSTNAVTQTLEAIRDRLLNLRAGAAVDDIDIKNMIDDDVYELVLEDKDELTDDDSVDIAEMPDLAQLNYEISKIEEFIALAKSIDVDSKSKCLLDALSVGFQETEKLGGARKSLIFTESRRTQDYLKTFLEANGYKGKIVLFNGSNSDKESTAIYNEWYQRNKYSGKVSGSKSADRRNALIEYFRDSADICIATEAASEGVNLQFCSFVINYDLPWNPQRIEQRIGRCHRYGQRNDVVVINFLNIDNYADVRVSELLEEKFKLFDGIFGSSDEVLGAIETGVDFEKRILGIYQKCRTQAEIQKEFDDLQNELDDKIKRTMKKARDILFENFDTEVHERLKLNIAEYLDRYTRIFWRLSRFILSDKAVFFDNYHCFMLRDKLNDFRIGRYDIISKERKSNTGTIYRANHKLGKYVLEKADAISEKCGRVVFDITHNRGFKLSLVEQLKGKKGYLTLYKYTVTSAEQSDYLLFAGFLDDGAQMTPEQCKKLFDCIGKSERFDVPDYWQSMLGKEIERYAEVTLEQVSRSNLLFIKEEEERLQKWSDDMILSLEKDIVNIKKQIRETERQSSAAVTTSEHLGCQEKLQELNKRRRNMRAKLEENEEAIIEKRQSLIKAIRNKMKQKTNLENIFTLRWEVI